jgi:hypothetical protein
MHQKEKILWMEGSQRRSLYFRLKWESTPHLFRNPLGRGAKVLQPASAPVH